ncbi:unnamed protein product [Paramecium sonneborni]|uniref:Transmembrane protein n=1 Tax=Paramecium sonneborni TaxID=65129 RepID=A0A8S1PZH5_9CILI|nr:unnamed protein product [Paramecium sonneborni]
MWNIKINNDSFIEQIQVLDFLIRNIMNWIILISIIISFTQACLTKQLTCDDLHDPISCESVYQRVVTCQWSLKTNQCKLLMANCIYYDNQDECQKQDQCGWNENRCQEKLIQRQGINCEDFISYASCVAIKENKLACTWKHNKCITISKCSEINDFMQCRNSRLQEQCQLVINGKASYKEKQYFYFGDIFDQYECRAKDCKFNQFASCKNFVNGRRCFQHFGECTQCSYFTTNQTCLETNQCVWDNEVCRNIMCYDFKEKLPCQLKPFCSFNETSLQCQTRTDNQLYCYAYDISSDPIKQNKEVEI